MGRDNKLGEFEELILLAILHLGGEAYGLEILNLLEEKAKRKASIGALYETLKRLTEKGFVTPRDTEGPPERKGRPRRYFEIEAIGERALDEAELARKGLRLCTEGGLI